MKKAILLLAITAFSYEMFWRVVPSGAHIGGRLGTTAGQVAANSFSTDVFSECEWGFWVSEQVCQICIIDPRLRWNLDSVDVNLQYELETPVRLESCGGCPLALGVRFIASDTLSWLPDFAPGENRFALRLKFHGDSTETPLYNRLFDTVRDAVHYTDEGYFGGALLEDRIFFSMLFEAPRAGSSYGDNRITAEISARFPLP